MLRVHASIVMTADARLANAFSRSRTAGISLLFSSTATWPRTAPIPCARAATRCGAFTPLLFAPRTVFPSMAITSQSPARAALVHSQAPIPGRDIGADQAKARRNVDSSAAPRTAPSTASTSRPASAAHCPIAANDLEPAMTAAIPAASSPASGCRRPRFLARVRDLCKEIEQVLAAGSRDRRRCHRRAVSLVAGNGERENFHRSARALPAARRHAGHITCRYDPTRATFEPWPLLLAAGLLVHFSRCRLSCTLIPAGGRGLNAGSGRQRGLDQHGLLPEGTARGRGRHRPATTGEGGRRRGPSPGQPAVSPFGSGRSWPPVIRTW